MKMRNLLLNWPILADIFSTKYCGDFRDVADINSSHIHEKNIKFVPNFHFLKFETVIFWNYVISPQEDKNVNEDFSRTTGKYADFKFFWRVVVDAVQMRQLSSAGPSAESAKSADFWRKSKKYCRKSQKNQEFLFWSKIGDLIKIC